MHTMAYVIFMIITIDGPCASGKGTVAYLLAQALGGAHLDSGLFYRTIGWVYQQQFANMQDTLIEDWSISTFPAVSEITWRWKDDLSVQPFFLGRSIDIQSLRDEKIGVLASKLAQKAELRFFVNQNIHHLAMQKKIIVADGRDMATVVFPDADIKFFLDAPAEIRAKRRFLDLQACKQDCTYLEVYEKILVRDAQDTTRAIAPLAPAKGAFIVQNTNKTIDHLVRELKDLVCKTHLT